MKRIYAFMFSILCLAMLTSCKGNGKTSETKKKTADDIKTVGVILGYDSDYLLSEKTDLNVVRYDYVSDIMMALKNGYIDAASLDSMSTRSVTAMSSGIRVLDNIYGQSGYIALFNSENDALRADYNEFVKKYHESEYYADALRRQEAFDGISFENIDIECTGTGETIVVAYAGEGFPASYYDAASGKHLGYELEPIRLWANERNYQIEFVPTVFSDKLMGISKKKYDIGIGYVSEFYGEDCSRFGVSISDPVFYADIDIFVIDDVNDIEVSSEMYDVFE